MAVTVRNLSGVQRTSVSLSMDLSMRLKEDILSGRLRKKPKTHGAIHLRQLQCQPYTGARALVHLEKEGLVESIPNRGSFVVGLSDQDLEDILTLRKIYEVQATRWAIARITEEELDQLEENFEFMEFYTMKEDVDKMLNINQNFHQMIYTASTTECSCRCCPPIRCTFNMHEKKRPGRTTIFPPSLRNIDKYLKHLSVRTRMPEPPPWPFTWTTRQLGSSSADDRLRDRVPFHTFHSRLP